MEKLAFISYVFSGIVLVYLAFINSPFNIANDDAWENSRVPMYFYTIVVIIIAHFLYTGKMLSKEKYPKVFWISGIIVVGAAFYMLPTILAFILY
jgi:hypothetical protein